MSDPKLDALRKEVTKEGPPMDYTDKNLAFPKPSGKKKKGRKK